MEMLQLINLSGNMMISLFELGHVDPIPINFVFVPSFMCLVCVYTYIYIYIKKIIKLMPGAYPVTTVISAVFFLMNNAKPG